MAIITQAEVKALLRITTADYDTLIDMLIPEVQGFIFSYCKNFFKHPGRLIKAKTLAFVAGSPASITDGNSDFLNSGLKENMEIHVENSNHNDGVLTIAAGGVLAGAITLAGTPDVVDEAAGNQITISQIKYPVGIKLAVAQLIGFEISVLSTNKGDRQIESEGFPDYKVKYVVAPGGKYPETLLAKLKPYKKKVKAIE